jgi:predicted lipoprotein
MPRKIVKYLLLVLIVGLLAYNSVYIKKLSEVQSKEVTAFDAASFAEKLWVTQLPARLDSAVALGDLQSTIKTNPALAFDTWFNSMSIGNIRYGLVKIAGKVLAVNDDDVTVLAGNAADPLTVKITTEYVYGNAIRDASRLVDIKDFVNTTDLNNVSEELNKRVRTRVLPAFKERVKKADSITCTGAIELNQAHTERSGTYSLSDLEIIPVQCKIIQQ